MNNIEKIIKNITNVVIEFNFQENKDFRLYINSLFIVSERYSDEESNSNYVGINSFDFINWATELYNWLNKV